MKSIVVGLGIFGITLLVGIISGDFTITMFISGLTGVISLLISGLLSGAFVSGDRVRANYSNENIEQSYKRQNLILVFFKIGIPNILGAIIIYKLIIT